MNLPCPAARHPLFQFRNDALLPGEEVLSHKVPEVDEVVPPHTVNNVLISLDFNKMTNIRIVGVAKLKLIAFPFH